MPSHSREYSFKNLSGCVEQRKSRANGKLVGLYHAEQAGLDPTDGRWVTVCEEDGALCSHGTIALARAHLCDPAGWCEACRGGAEELESVAVSTTNPEAVC